MYITIFLYRSYTDQPSFLLILLALVPAILLKTTMPLITSLKTWSPFKIDALGIVTLLGADAVRKALGRLVHSPFEYFPLLAGHIFADNSVADPTPGFILYNITDGIMATDLSAWFTRWLLCQKLAYCSTRLDIRDAGEKTERTVEEYVGPVLGFLLNTFLIIWPILMADWYGFAAAMSLVALVLVRLYILWACRQGLDAQFRYARAPTKMKEVKLLVTLPNGQSRHSDDDDRYHSGLLTYRSSTALFQRPFVGTHHLLGSLRSTCSLSGYGMSCCSTGPCHSHASVFHCNGGTLAFQ